MNQPPSQGGFPPPGQFPQQTAQPQFPPHASGQSGGGAPMDSRDADPKKAQAAGFLRSLFDFSFENFVSVRVLKVLYGLWLFMLLPSFFGLLFAWYSALTHQNYDYMTGQSTSDPLFAEFCGSTVAYPIAVFVWVLLGRILFERGVLAFRQYDLSREILQELRKR